MEKKPETKKQIQPAKRTAQLQAKQKETPPSPKNKASSKKPILITVAVAAIAVIAIGIVIFVMTRPYSPDDGVLSIVNEAAVIQYGSEITDDYELEGSESIDDKTFYQFKFTLENGQSAVFLFAKDLEETYVIYAVEGDTKTAIILTSGESEGDDRDNTAEWPEEWS